MKNSQLNDISAIHHDHLSPAVVGAGTGADRIDFGVHLTVALIIHDAIMCIMVDGIRIKISRSIGYHGSDCVPMETAVVGSVGDY
jgi:hypothetical protein